MSDRPIQLTNEGERFLSPLHRLEFPPIEPPKPGRAVALAEGVLWARLPLPMELNHINVWLLEDADGWTLIDTGLADAPSMQAWERLEVEALGGRPLTRIFLTHNHPDHMGLAAWLSQRHGAAVWTSEKCHVDARVQLETEPRQFSSDLREFVRSHGATPSRSDAMGGNEDHRAWFSGVPRLDHAPVDGDELVTAGAGWRLYRTDGHCTGHMCLHSAQRSMLISGDQLLPTISSNVGVWPDEPEANPLQDFLDSLTRLEDCTGDTLVLPSHGRPFLGLHRRTRDLQRHHMEQLDAVRQACIEPRSAYDVLPAMFGGRALTGFHRVLALAEAVAHLHYLMHAGELERSRDGDGVHRFVVS